MSDDTRERSAANALPVLFTLLLALVAAGGWAMYYVQTGATGDNLRRAQRAERLLKVREADNGRYRRELDAARTHQAELERKLAAAQSNAALVPTAKALVGQLQQSLAATQSTQEQLQEKLSQVLTERDKLSAALEAQEAKAAQAAAAAKGPPPDPALKQAVAALRQALGPQIAAGRVAVEERDDGGVLVRIGDGNLFRAGSSALQPAGSAILAKVAELLKRFPRRWTVVAGHTDNLPLSTAMKRVFGSNWGLSSARANAIVRYLQYGQGVNPKRLVTAGYGKYQPLADNTSAAGRAKNRRVEISLLPDDSAQPDAALARPTKP